MIRALQLWRPRPTPGVFNIQSTLHIYIVPSCATKSRVIIFWMHGSGGRILRSPGDFWCGQGSLSFRRKISGENILNRLSRSIAGVFIATLLYVSTVTKIGLMPRGGRVRVSESISKRLGRRFVRNKNDEEQWIIWVSIYQARGVYLSFLSIFIFSGVSVRIELVGAVPISTSSRWSVARKVNVTTSYSSSKCHSKFTDYWMKAAPFSLPQKSSTLYIPRRFQLWISNTL